jgi:hypothetical protein
LLSESIFYGYCCLGMQGKIITADKRAKIIAALEAYQNAAHAT